MKITKNKIIIISIILILLVSFVIYDLKKEGYICNLGNINELNGKIYEEQLIGCDWVESSIIKRALNRLGDRTNE